MVRSLFNTLVFAILLAFPLVSNAAPVQQKSSSSVNTADLGGFSITSEQSDMPSNGSSFQITGESSDDTMNPDSETLDQVTEVLPVAGYVASRFPLVGHAELEDNDGDLVEDLDSFFRETDHVVKATAIATIDILKAILDPVFDQ